VRSAAKEKQGLGSLLSYLLTLADHAWVASRLRQQYPMLYEAQARWGLDTAQMLVGSESMFNRYLSERNLKKLLSVLQDGGEDANAFRTAVMERLAMLTAQILEHEKDESRKMFLAVQLANVRLLNPDAYTDYQEMLTSNGLSDVREALPMAERLYTELTNTAVDNQVRTSAKEREDRQPMVIDSGQYHRALEAGVKALGMANYFEVKG